MAKKTRAPDPLIPVLSRFKRTDTPAFEDAWVGMEPTFQSKKSVSHWHKLAAEPGGEDAYFRDPYMLGTQKDVARTIEKRFAKKKKGGAAVCFFDRVEREVDIDPWKTTRQALKFKWKDEKVEDFEVRFTLDPETFEFSIKPVPLAWFEDARFVDFLQEFVWDVPEKHGLSPSIAHGGCQFSLSAKTFLQGSLLADDLADRLNHPELTTWLFDWPNADDRSFRATPERFAAFGSVLAAYWEGRFHPDNKGPLTAANAFFDRGFEPATKAAPQLMKRGPSGDARAVFQTNFGFGRAVRLYAQNVHPGYWQAAHPKEDGYRADQVMRYSEGNLNRLQVAGEWHVKSGKPLQVDRAPDLDEVLEVAHLTAEASWENRGQMGRTSARDFVEALRLSTNRARHLAAHPQVKLKTGLGQDALLIDAEKTVAKHAGAKRLEQLRKDARALNLESSHGRLKSSFIEPETLFFAAWHALPLKEQGAIAREVVSQFVTYVEEARAMDPRQPEGDPMEWHRHRVHPALWTALTRTRQGESGAALEQLKAFEENAAGYLARRPRFSQLEEQTPPWETAARKS